MAGNGGDSSFRSEWLFHEWSPVLIGLSSWIRLRAPEGIGCVTVFLEKCRGMYRGSGSTELATGCGLPLPVEEINKKGKPRRGCTCQSRQISRSARAFFNP